MEYENQFMQATNQSVKEITIKNTIYNDVTFNAGSEYEYNDTFLYDDPVQTRSGYWYVQRHGDNRYTPSTLETYVVFDNAVSADSVYSTIQSELLLQYSNTPFVLPDKSEKGFLLSGVIDAEETEQGDNQ